MRNLRAAVSMVAAMIWLAACSHCCGSPSSTASPGASHRRAPSERKGVTSIPAPTPPPVVATPVASVAGSASAASRPRVKVPRLAANAAPKILSIGISETTVHPGDRISGSVTTTSNVASVEARIGGYSMTLPKLGVGRFALTYTVAPLPWFIRGNFTMSVIARNPRGDSVKVAVPLTVR
jgi:hypothetical protein